MSSTCRTNIYIDKIYKAVRDNRIIKVKINGAKKGRKKKIIPLLNIARALGALPDPLNNSSSKISQDWRE
tara:strand:- start:125 stop:334 length:210 start_codon:yes stop_codon:yes gene_type:complete